MIFTMETNQSLDTFFSRSAPKQLHSSHTEYPNHML